MVALDIIALGHWFKSSRCHQLFFGFESCTAYHLSLQSMALYFKQNLLINLSEYRLDGNISFFSFAFTCDKMPHLKAIIL